MLFKLCVSSNREMNIDIWRDAQGDSYNGCWAGTCWYGFYDFLVVSLAKNIFQPSLLFYLSFWVKVCSFQHWSRVRFLLLLLCFVFVFKFVLSQGWGGLLKMFSLRFWRLNQGSNGKGTITTQLDQQIPKIYFDGSGCCFLYRSSNDSARLLPSTLKFMKCKAEGFYFLFYVL